MLDKGLILIVFISGFAFGVPQIHPAFIQRPYGYVKLLNFNFFHNVCLYKMKN